MNPLQNQGDESKLVDDPPIDFRNSLAAMSEHSNA
jgi:hypothetical protein